MDSELGYFEHHQLEREYSTLRRDHAKLRSATERYETSNGKLRDEVGSARREIVQLQKAIQRLQVRVDMLHVTPSVLYHVGLRFATSARPPELSECTSRRCRSSRTCLCHVTYLILLVVVRSASMSGWRPRSGRDSTTTGGA